MNILLEKYIDLYNEMKKNDKNCIPLCAAETYISEFVKQPLNSEFEGKYYFFKNNKIEELKDLTLRFKGSSNQRTILVQPSLKEGRVVLWDPSKDTLEPLEQ